MMVVLLNQRGCVGKTMLARPLAGQWRRQGKQITLIDVDPQSSSLHWPEQHARRRFERPFGAVMLACGTLHRGLSELARRSGHIVIDGPPRAAFQRGVAVADMLRDLLAREFPDIDGGQS